MSTTFTPLRYPGGKSRLARYFSHLLVQNNLHEHTYIEPFAGGAGAAITLLRNNYVKDIILNDIDPGIYSFWFSALNHTDDLCKRVSTATLTIDEWHRQRTIARSPQEHSEIDLGFATLYMNRTNRSGIINGGVIGGQQQQGKWKMDARFNRAGLVNKITQIAQHKSRIKIFRLDALDFLNETVISELNKAFIYIDPPYYKKGQALYENHYIHEDHCQLERHLHSIKHKNWVVSYDNVQEINDIYSSYNTIAYGINYSAAQRYKGNEVLFFGPTITPPDAPDPLSIKRYAKH